MTSVKINHGKTPSEQVIEQSQSEMVVTDSRGRSITLKNPGVLAQYRLVKMIGAEAAKNEVYVNMMLPILWVVRIDDSAIHAPSSEREIEALISRLGEEGIASIVGHMQAGSVDNKDDQELVKN